MMQKFGVVGLFFFVFGCASPSRSTTPAQEFDAVVEYNGVTTRSALAFPERNLAATHTDADSTCDWSSGNCGSDLPTYAEVDGEAPIKSAAYTTDYPGDGIYDVTIQQTAVDDAAERQGFANRGFRLPGEGGTVCRVYDSQIGERTVCPSRSKVFITLTRR